MWHDADAGSLALLRFDSLRAVADPGGLRGRDTGALESAGLGISSAWSYLLDAYARGSRSGVARGALHGSTRGEDGATRHLWTCGYWLCYRGIKAHCPRTPFSNTDSRIERRREFFASRRVVWFVCRCFTWCFMHGLSF